MKTFKQYREAMDINDIPDRDASSTTPPLTDDQIKTLAGTEEGRNFGINILMTDLRKDFSQIISSLEKAHKLDARDQIVDIFKQAMRVLNIAQAEHIKDMSKPKPGGKWS